ncbi:hypothetical protein [Nostoc sp. 'Peltigera malacea cyanobiont' DB3992]|uniref:hypothetical protein n=1 Tax=Nostoc sp. 'Peltigera malacea cyanobiont' DB3992 TaxID=1206980 RepID=UPI000C063B11|nr:hypothetical protein [Nostoc sp. 'Peltigera malacea cyanobiont' DB3992]PHM05849.1 hypothetical protein CK516_37950 [Nostoc sp. 'Peltigera malacea cyanobiont' DB3992]
MCDRPSPHRQLFTVEPFMPIRPMHFLLKIVPIFSLALATSLPFSLVQAQTSNQTCQALLNEERTYDVNWYPVKPLPSKRLIYSIATERQNYLSVKHLNLLKLTSTAIALKKQ